MLTLSALISGSAAMAPLPDFKPAPREFRAAWVATVDNIDWPSRKGLSSDAQRRELVRIFDTAKRVGLNAIVFQTRTSCDTFYDSSIEPWSEFLTGRQGLAPDPYYDPLTEAIDLAHSRGIELHVWFNPYRAKHPAATGPLASNHIANARPDLAKTYGRYVWMDPGEPETRKWTLKVMLDVVRRYDVDGVHIDDYFYPYVEKDSAGKNIPFPDEPSYRGYQSIGGKLGKKDWRRKNVDDFVEEMYSSIRAAKPWVKVGISPFGIARPNLPVGIKAGIDQFDDPLYADCLKWFRAGWCDYFSPQLYWAIDSPGQPYKKLLKWWAEQNVKKRALWPGNYSGRVFPSNGNWSVDEVANQVLATRKQDGAGGNVHFSFKSIDQNIKGLADRFRNDVYAAPALVPAMPWKSAPTPKTPKARFVGADRLEWDIQSGIRWWAVYRANATKWELIELRPGHDDSVRLFVNRSNTVRAFAVTAIAANGIESEPAILPFESESNQELRSRVEP